MSVLNTLVTLHKQASKQSFLFLAKQPLTSVLTICMIALVLMLSALFWRFADVISVLNDDWQKNGHIFLYLQTTTNADEAGALFAQVQATANVAEARLITPKQGLENLQQQGGIDDVSHYLKDNPLPFVIDVVPAASITTPKSLEQLRDVLRAYPHVDEVSLDMTWIERLFALLHFLSHLMMSLNGLLAAAVVLIIGNTLRLIIRDHQDEMMVYKWVGAHDGYIMRPFLYAGIWYGLIAASLALSLVDGLIAVFNAKLAPILSSYTIHYHLSGLTLLQSVGLLLLASLLGWVGAFGSTRMVLREST